MALYGKNIGGIKLSISRAFKVLLFLICFCFLAIPAEAQTEMGYIEIPAIKIKMTCFSADNESEQDIIDNEKSALYYPWLQAFRIVDHAFSEDENGNVWNIQKIFPGAYAIIKINGKKYFYECYLSAKTDYKYDQEFINGRLITPVSSYDIMLSCCAENSDHHFIAIFRRLSEFK